MTCRPFQLFISWYPIIYAPQKLPSRPNRLQRDSAYTAVNMAAAHEKRTHQLCEFTVGQLCVAVTLVLSFVVQGTYMILYINTHINKPHGFNLLIAVTIAGNENFEGNIQLLNNGNPRYEGVLQASFMCACV